MIRILADQVPAVFKQADEVRNDFNVICFLLCVIGSIVETDSPPFVDGVQQDMQPIRPLTRSQSVDLSPSVLSVSSAFLVLLEPTKIDRISGLGHYKSKLDRTRWCIDKVREIHTAQDVFGLGRRHVLFGAVTLKKCKPTEVKTGNFFVQLPFIL